jgi:hypothetical protein
MTYPYANPSNICNALSRVFTKVEAERSLCTVLFFEGGREGERCTVHVLLHRILKNIAVGGYFQT